MTNETRRVPGFEQGYVVSQLGRIRNASTGKLLFGELDRDGYRKVNLTLNGKSYKRRVHRLVCEAFHGPCPDGKECGHLDGNPQNNQADNLAWVTRSENTKHQIAHGTFRRAVPPPEAMRRGEQNAASRLTETVVRDCRRRHAAGESGRALAKEFGITSANMSRMLRGDTWSHVPNGDAPND